MSKYAIVFYCKTCGALFFAAMTRPNVLRGCAAEIDDYIANGDRMEVIDTDVTPVRLERCHCYDKQPDRAGELPLFAAPSGGEE